MSSAPVLSESERRALLETPLTRFYVRLGAVLGLGLVVASALVWTGAFEWMLTFGNWGRLSQRDLLGFLVAVFWMMTAALLVVLFTLKRTLTRVEVDVQARDIELDQRVRDMQAHIAAQLGDAQSDLRHEHEQLAILAARSRDSDRRVLERARAEVDHRVRAARAEIGNEIDRVKAELERRAKSDDAMRVQALVSNMQVHQSENGLVDRVAASEEHQVKLVGILRAETQALRELRDEVTTRMAKMDTAQADNVGRDLAQSRTLSLLAEDHKDAIEGLRERMRIERSDMERTMDSRIRGLVDSGVNERIKEAIEVAFRPGRFYKVLAAALGSAVLFIGILALAGATGPGIFTARVAIFGLALTSLALTGVVLVLIWSFTDTVRTLRGFAGRVAR